MIIPMDKLVVYNSNKYIFTRAAMKAVDKVTNIKDYPEENYNWKVVPNVLKLVLNSDIKLVYTEPEAEQE